MNSRTSLGVFVSLSLMVGIGGCVTDVQTNSEKANLSPSPNGAKAVEVTRAVIVQLRSGYSSALIKGNSVWIDAGTIERGSVYRPIDDVMEVYAGTGPGVPLPAAGSRAYEAHIVVSKGVVVGVFLPTENAFISAPTPQPISMQEKTR